MKNLTGHTAAILHRRAIVSVLDNAATVAGACALLLALHGLTPPHAPLSVIMLAALALAVRAFPLAGRETGPTITALTPVLAILDLDGSGWAIVVMAATMGAHGVFGLRRDSGFEDYVRGIAHASLATALAGVVFTAVAGLVTGDALALALPPLFAAAGVLAIVSWALAASRHVARTGASYGELARESVVGVLPALASEPVLALVLSAAAAAGSPAALVAASLPLAGLVIALHLHATMHWRLQRMEMQLRVQATTDALTGLANRRLFEETLAARMEEAGRYERPLGVLLLDLDDFKGINDAYGHAAGDEVLVAVAGALRRGLRRSDVPARLAGDEFVALLPETTNERALALARRVCAEIVALEVAVGEVFVRVSASVGVASTDGRLELDAGSLLAAADRAAYAAKAAGKNSVYLAGAAPQRDAAARGHIATAS